jgi:hypothetical protein
MVEDGETVHAGDVLAKMPPASAVRVMAELAIAALTFTL